MVDNGDYADSTNNENIRKIIEILGHGSKTPKQLAKELGMHEVTVSRYLKTLKDDNLVKIKRDQNQLYYSLNLNQWKNHVEATINLAGEMFTKKFKAQDHQENIWLDPNVAKITLDFDHPDFLTISNLIGSPYVKEIFRILTEPMTIGEVCKKVKVPKTTLYKKICELEELVLVAKKEQKLKDFTKFGAWKYEKSFESLNVIVQNEGESIVIIPKMQYFPKIVNRLNEK